MAHAPVTEQEQSLYEFVSTAMSTTVSVQIVGAHSNAPSLAAEAFERAAMKLPIKTKVVARLGDTSHLGGE